VFGLHFRIFVRPSSFSAVDWLSLTFLRIYYRPGLNLTLFTYPSPVIPPSAQFGFVSVQGRAWLFRILGCGWATSLFSASSLTSASFDLRSRLNLQGVFGLGAVLTCKATSCVASLI
jgi:hypothetical protein